METKKNLESEIERIAQIFLKKTKDKEIEIISHFDTDGITTASIIIQTLEKLDKRFSLKIVKSLEENLIRGLPKNKVILFLDLGSNSFDYMEESELKDIFIIDHHEIVKKIPNRIEIINPQLNNKQKSAVLDLLTYSPKNCWVQKNQKSLQNWQFLE